MGVGKIAWLPSTLEHDPEQFDQQRGPHRDGTDLEIERARGEQIEERALLDLIRATVSSIFSGSVQRIALSSSSWPRHGS